MWTGFGIRTLGAAMGAYNPMSYHNGSIWPHDNAIVAAGLMRYGFVAEAQRIALGVLDAAHLLGGRLPELFCGFDRADFPTPVPYPTSCSPQAWSAAAPIQLVRTLLRFEPDLPAGRIGLNPAVPEPMLELADEHKPAHNWDVLVLLTDLPRRAGTQPIVSTFSTSRGVGLVSIPALGAFHLKYRARHLLVHLIGHLLEKRLGLDPESRRHSPRGRLEDLFAPTKHVHSYDRGIDMHLALTGLRGRLRLLAGMVRDNRLPRTEQDDATAMPRPVTRCLRPGRMRRARW